MTTNPAATVAAYLGRGLDLADPESVKQAARALTLATHADEEPSADVAEALGFPMPPASALAALRKLAHTEPNRRAYRAGAAEGLALVLCAMERGRLYSPRGSVDAVTALAHRWDDPPAVDALAYALTHPGQSVCSGGATLHAVGPAPAPALRTLRGNLRRALAAALDHFNDEDRPVDEIRAWFAAELRRALGDDQPTATPHTPAA